MQRRRAMGALPTLPVKVITPTPATPAAQTGVATPGSEAGALYKFGMSPLLWGIIAVAGVGGVYYYWRRKHR